MPKKERRMMSTSSVDAHKFPSHSRPLNSVAFAFLSSTSLFLIFHYSVYNGAVHGEAKRATKQKQRQQHDTEVSTSSSWFLYVSFWLFSARLLIRTEARVQEPLGTFVIEAPSGVMAVLAYRELRPARRVVGSSPDVQVGVAALLHTRVRV